MITNRIWRVEMLLLCICLFIQRPTAAEDNPTPTQDERLACGSDIGHWRSGYWDFGPDGSWSSAFVICPLTGINEGVGMTIADCTRSRPEQTHLPSTDIRCWRTRMLLGAPTATL
jgi:hypothetical protein